MKIFKLFVSLCLIISISLINSIAAISVSDGSAFVTKAEFAADLNNLSNRMSSLENSLDAKIDSLVSSYLSRNGIWNGEKQTSDIILGSSVLFDMSDKSSTVIKKDANGYTYTVGIGSGSVKANGTQKDINRSAVQSTSKQQFFLGMGYKFVKISKSGLLSFSVTFQGRNSSFNEIGMNVSSWSTNDRENGLSGVAGVVLSKGDEYNFNNSNSQWVASSLYGYGTGVYTQTNEIIKRVYIGFPFGKINLLGFVNKDDELNLGFVVSGYSAYYSVTSWSLMSEGGFGISDLDAVVY